MNVLTHRNINGLAIEGATTLNGVAVTVENVDKLRVRNRDRNFSEKIASETELVSDSNSDFVPWRSWVDIFNRKTLLSARSRSENISFSTRGSDQGSKSNGF